MKKRIKFDRNSIGAKLCSYFLFFTVFVIGVLWVLQTIFLVHYYQGMKIDSIRKVSNEIEESYQEGNMVAKINEKQGAVKRYWHMRNFWKTKKVKK